MCDAGAGMSDDGAGMLIMIDELHGHQRYPWCAVCLTLGQACLTDRAGYREPQELAEGGNKGRSGRREPQKIGAVFSRSANMNRSRTRSNMFPWCSGYHVRLTRERWPVRSWQGTLVSFCISQCIAILTIVYIAQHSQRPHGQQENIDVPDNLMCCTHVLRWIQTPPRWYCLGPGPTCVNHNTCRRQGHKLLRSVDNSASPNGHCMHALAATALPLWKEAGRRRVNQLS